MTIPELTPSGWREAAERGTEGVCDLVDGIVREGLRRGASDIHVEPGPAEVLIRFRLDGVLHPAIPVATNLQSNVVARLKVLADLLTYQTDVPQEGRIDRARVGAAADLRVSTFPTVHGEKVVIRLFDPRTQDVAMDRLGYPQDVRAELERRLCAPKGVILLTGPAGSGKTTTIYAALRFILEASGGARNVVTVEDPVERVLPGITQTQVHPASGLTFARCLRSLLRQDPEVIVIGEVRDSETASIAVEAGLTGHLVISTLHSGTAPGVFARLLEMEIPPYLATSSVSFVAAQRLVRRLCEQCREEVTAGATDGSGRPGRVFRAKGCEVCFGTGYRGRMPLVETLAMSEAIRRCILDRASLEEFQRAASAVGMRSLEQRAWDAVAAGATSLEEIRRVLGPEVSEAR